MPIKWSAVRVSEAMDEVAEQIALAEPFLAEARARIEAARRIDDLPQYVDQRLIHLLTNVERLDYVKRSAMPSPTGPLRPSKTVSGTAASSRSSSGGEDRPYSQGQLCPQSGTKGGDSMEHKDILLDPDEDKERVYEQIHARYLQGKPVKLQEDESGFPAVTVDCEDMHILTDIISLERWWAKKKEQERS